MIRKVIQLYRVDTGAEAVVVATVDKDSVEYNVLSENENVRQDLRSLLKSFIFNLSPTKVDKKLVYKAKISVPDTKEHLINLIDLLSWNGYVVKQISDKTVEKSALGLEEDETYHVDLAERIYPVLPILSYYLKSLKNQESDKEVLKSFSFSSGEKDYIKNINGKQYLIRVPPGFMLENTETGKVYLPGQFVGQIPLESLGQKYLVIPIQQEGRELSEDERKVAENAFNNLKTFLVKKLNDLFKQDPQLENEFSKSGFSAEFLKKIVDSLDENEKKEFLDNLTKLEGIVGERLPNIVSSILEEIENFSEEEQKQEQEDSAVSYEDIVDRLAKELNISKEKRAKLSRKYVPYETILKELLRYALKEKSISKENVAELFDKISIAEKAQKFGVIARDSKSGDIVLVKLPDVLQDDELESNLLASGNARVFEDPFTKDPNLINVLLKDYLFLFTDKVPIVSEKGKITVDNWDTIKPYLNFLFNVLLRNIDAATSRNVIDYLRETSSVFATNPNLSEGSEQYHGRRLPEFPGDAFNLLIDNLKEAGVKGVPISLMLGFSSGEELRIKEGSLIDKLIKEGILTTKESEIREFFKNLSEKLRGLEKDLEQVNSRPANPSERTQSLDRIIRDISAILSILSQESVSTSKLEDFLKGIDEFKRLVARGEYVRVLHSFGDEDAKTITKEFVQKQEEFADQVEAKVYGLFFDGRSIYSDSEIKDNLKDYVDYLFLERGVISEKMALQLKKDVDLIFGQNGIVKDSRVTFLGLIGQSLEENKSAFSRVISLLIQNPFKNEFEKLNNPQKSSKENLDKLIEEDANKILNGRFLNSLLNQKNSIYLYQLYGIVFSLNKALNRHQGGFSEKVGSILFWEGGLGKTVTQVGTILLGKDLGIIHPDKPVLVFAPENVIGNWLRDAQNVFGLSSGFIVPNADVLVVRDVDVNKREASYKLLTLLYSLKQIDRRISELEAQGVNLLDKTSEKGKEYLELVKKKNELESAYKELTGASVPRKLPDIVIVGTYKTQRASKETTADRLFSNDSRALITMSKPVRIKSLAIPYANQKQGYFSSNVRKIVDINLTLNDSVFGGMVIDEAGMVMNPATLRHKTMAAIKSGITSDTNKGLVWLLNAEEVSTSPLNTAALLNLTHYYGNILDPKSVYLYKVGGRNIYLWKSGSLRVLRAFSSKLTNDTIYGQKIKGHIKSEADGVSSKKVSAVIGEKNALLEFDIPLVSDNFNNEEIRVLPYSEDVMLKPLVLHTALDQVTRAKALSGERDVAITAPGILYSPKGRGKGSRAGYKSNSEIDLTYLSESYRPAFLQMQREALLGIFPRDRAFEYGFDKTMNIKIPKIDIIKEVFGSTEPENKKDKIRELYRKIVEGKAESSEKTIRELYLDIASSMATHLYGVANEQEFRQDFEKALDKLLEGLRASLGSAGITIEDLSNTLSRVVGIEFSPFYAKTSDGRIYGLTSKDMIYFPNYAGVVGRGDDLSADVEDVDDIQRQEFQEDQGVSMLGVGQRDEEFNLRKNFIRARNMAMSAIFNIAMRHAQKLIELDLDSDEPPFEIELKRNGDEVYFRINYYVKEDGERKKVEYDPAKFQSTFNLSQRGEIKILLESFSDPNTEYDLEGETIKLDPHTLLSLFVNFYQDANVYENNKDKLNDVFSLSDKPVLGFEHKAIILSPSRKHASSIYRLAKNLHDPNDTAVGAIVGGTPVEKQEQIIKQHTNRHGLKTITVLTTRAAGRGLNLPSSKTLVFSPYSYEELRQALARGVRSAQLFTDISKEKEDIEAKKKLLAKLKQSKVKPEDIKKLEEEIREKEKYLESLNVKQRTVLDAATVFPVLQRTVLATLQDVASKPKLPSAKEVQGKRTATELDERERSELHLLAEQINTWLGLERTEGYLRRYWTLLSRVNKGQQGGILGALERWLGSFENYNTISDSLAAQREKIVEMFKDIMQKRAKYSNLTDEDIEKLIHGIFV
jgi:hypothetical protein